MKINRKKRFSTVYIAKKPFWTMKTSVSKTHKTGIFPKGLVHGFGEKRFVLCIIHQEKVFGYILITKQPFLDYTNIDLKSMQNCFFFPKAIVHDDAQKLEVFSYFVFIQNRSRKSVC